MNKFRANVLFWIIALLSLLPFVILPFFCHPIKEDYFFESNFKYLNFWEGQRVLYNYWSGRFFTNALEIACLKMNFISDLYFLLPLLLFALTFIAFFHLVRTANHFFTKDRLTTNTLLQVSCTFLLLNIYLVADIASNFYWFSGAIVYQTPVIILLIILQLLIKRFSAPAKTKRINDVVIVLLLILLIGCNETAAVATIVLLFIAALASNIFRWREKKIISLYFCAAFIAGLFVFFTSGILARQKMMNSSTSYITVVPIILFRTWAVFYNIFKEPLFWIAALFCVVAGSSLQNDKKIQRIIVFFSAPKKLYYCFLLIPVMVAAILTPLLLVAKGSFPERALNSVILVTALCLLLLALVCGQVFFKDKFNSITQKIQPLHFVLIPGAALLLSVTYTDAWKSVLSGYFYHAVKIERDKQFLQAKNNHQTTIAVLPYDVVLQQKINEKMPGGGFKSVYKLLLRPPSTIPFFDEATEPKKNYFRAYYGIDSIIIKTDNPK